MRHKSLEDVICMVMAILFVESNFVLCLFGYHINFESLWLIWGDLVYLLIIVRFKLYEQVVQCRSTALCNVQPISCKHSLLQNNVE